MQSRVVDYAKRVSMKAPHRALHRIVMALGIGVLLTGGGACSPGGPNDPAPVTSQGLTRSSAEALAAAAATFRASLYEEEDGTLASASNELEPISSIDESDAALRAIVESMQSRQATRMKGWVYCGNFDQPLCHLCCDALGCCGTCNGQTVDCE